MAPRAAKVPRTTYHWHMESSSLPNSSSAAGEPFTSTSSWGSWERKPVWKEAERLKRPRAGAG